MFIILNINYHMQVMFQLNIKILYVEYKEVELQSITIDDKTNYTPPPPIVFIPP